MNAVEIEEAVCELVEAPFDPAEFPYALLLAFGDKETTVRRLRASNKSDVPGGVLKTGMIHIAACDAGQVSDTLAALRASPRSAKVKFILATDGQHLEAEELATGEPLACDHADLPNHFGFLLPLAGISTVKAIKENPIDVKATGRLNKLYVELLKDNPDWGAEEKRPELNRLLARLIFCFFAEDTGIFPRPGQFTKAIHDLTQPDGANVHEVMGELFRAMATHQDERKAAGIKGWADDFLYVNGGLFSDAGEVPRFTRTSRNYLLRAGELSWQQINPDIFGSMIQGVADEDERSNLGMHYTSVPNILKVLNPLFLDDLREQLDAAGDSVRKLRALRKRIGAIRVFDPACGSGNFLVIAYIQMRQIEHEIVQRTGDDPRSVIPLTNFYGIEIKGFAAEIARLALLIAEFQMDARLIDQRQACANVLPLHATGQITIGNALRLDWEEVCPPARRSPPLEEHDLAGPTGRLALEVNALSIVEEPETFVCGNPPYLGKGKKTPSQQKEMDDIFRGRLESWGYVDYVGCWFLLAADYCRANRGAAALVATNSLCQGRQLPQLWPHVISGGVEIFYAHRSFKWNNSALNNAAVTCIIVGISRTSSTRKKAIVEGDLTQSATTINAYLLPAENVYVESSPRPLAPELPTLVTGSVPNDGGNLLFALAEKQSLTREHAFLSPYIHRFLGSQDYLQGLARFALILDAAVLPTAAAIPEIRNRLDRVTQLRLESPKQETRTKLARTPHQFQHFAGMPKRHAIIVPSVSSEAREWFPVGLLTSDQIVSNLAFVMMDPELWSFSLLSSRLHLSWIGIVCGKLKTDYRYSNTLGWHTFPVPPLTAQNKADLNRCAEDILLAREAHFPATIAELYDPEAMPDDLRRAHERNDETLERIYIGRRFRNDTERLEKLFEMYTRMTASDGPGGDKAKPKKSRKAA